MLKQHVKHYYQRIHSTIHHKLKLTRIPLIHSGYKTHQKDLALASCIQSLLLQNIIEKVEKVKYLGFYSRLSLVPKPHQGGGK